MKLWATIWSAIALALAALPAFAQDFPTLKGNNQRTGRNAAPGLNGPGRSFLRWFRPNLADFIGNTQVIDNLNLPPASIFTNGAAAPFLWTAPATVADQANNPFIPDPNADPLTNPAYMYVPSTESALGIDPTIPLNAANHATWTTTINPPDGIARNYALYAWLPIGPTTELGVTKYQSRFFVYEILFGTGQRWIDVVDTFVAGSGWVRLGNGGRPTTLMFNYNGINPIQVILHNTVPRDDGGGLMDSVGNLVYADAVQAVPEVGTYTASPIVAQFGLPGDIHTVVALNRFESDAQAQEAIQGEVSSLDHDSSIGADNTRWRFVVGNNSFATPVQQDNTDAGVTVGLGWTAQIAPAIFVGPDYLSQGITNTAGAETTVDYAPTLTDGQYEIWAWLPQSLATFGQSVRYEFREGPANSFIFVDQNRPASAWVRIGGRRFTHTLANPLSVRISNYSPLATDLGRQAFADALRFVPAGGGVPIHSTPLQVTAGIVMTPAGLPVDTSVILVAAEDGKIYCLDATGNGDGTTNCYWTYPSTRDPSNPVWTDPNQVGGEDGAGPIAEMPTGFDLSSALVERIGTEDFLWVGSRNGRVYCIEMAGRGDMNLATRVPGTTRRRWTYPNDYPAPTVPSFLGQISASLSFATTAAGPTIFVATREGRIRALDATGNAATKTTTERWIFPALNVAPVGEIIATPVIDFGNIYFGTMRNPATDMGEFYALNIDTGLPSWVLLPPNCFTGPQPLWGGLSPSHFASGPITIPATELTGTPNIVVVANDNGWITAIDAATGIALWATNELESNVIGNLTYSPLTVFGPLGVYLPFPEPCVIVPTQDGRLAALFANLAQLNVFGGRLAWGFDSSAGGFVASAAVGRNWMYAADTGGNLFAFNDTPGLISPGQPPGQEVVTPNDPKSIPFREAELVFITKPTYEALRLQTGQVGHLNYAQASNPANQVPAVPPPPYEWGETIYLMVYKFPYELDTNPIPPGQQPQVEFRVNVEGSSIRNMTVRAKQFSNLGGFPPPIGVSGEVLDGYAVISFTLQGSGGTAVPPGIAEVTAAISAQFAAGERLLSVALTPALIKKNFIVNNPLAVAVKFDAAGQPLANYEIGYTIDRYNPEAQVNGSPDIPATLKNESLLLASPGYTAHNQTGVKMFAIVDRSLMRLLRGEKRGLDQVRVELGDLGWQGGIGAVVKPIDSLAYPNFEDLPVNFPNNSIDYPNIFRDRVSIVKDRFGNTENPLLNAVSLIPPLAGSVPFDPNTRILEITPTEAEIAVPRFQPANLTLMPNSDVTALPPNNTEPAGYLTRLNIWVDSTGNGQLERIGRREAFRSILLGTAVAKDEKIVVATPTVDLGSLAHGTGFRADGFPHPWDQTPPFTSPFNPWMPTYDTIFKPFVVMNEGNVNMLDMRLAKSTKDDLNAPYPWGLFAPGNHERSWLDTQWNLWSDIDATFAPNNLAGNNRVLLPKARVGDSAPTELSVNPKRRTNINLGVTEGYLLPTSGPGSFPPGPPRVGISVPIGFPVGAYVTTLRVIEDEVVRDEALGFATLSGGVLQAIEPYSDPGFSLRFTIRESRLTNSYTKLTAPMVHDLIVGGENYIHQSAQPAAMRDVTNGHLVMAYASTMSAFNQPQPATERLNDEWRIYLVSLEGTTPTAPGVAGASVVRDLNFWTRDAAGARYFRQETGPFPAITPGMFGETAGETVIAGTEKFGAPALPLLGMSNPYNPYNAAAAHSLGYLTFIGEAQIQTPGGRRSSSRPFIAAFTVGANGALAVQPVTGLPSAEGGVKGRPAVVATANNEGSVFFAAGGFGQTQIYHLSFQYDGAANYALTQLRQLPLSSGFESMGAPSIHARTYRGAPVTGLGTGDPMFEMTFAGKLRGRPHSEVFFARLAAGGAFGGPINIPGTNSPLVFLPQRTNERMAPDGETGVYRALGVNWDLNATMEAWQLLNGSLTNLEVVGTRLIDRQTNMISFDTTLGGKVYLDSNLGTVRFAGTVPARDAVILLTYTPRILRVSSGVGAAYSTPTGIFDNRLIGEFSYWARSDNSSLVIPGGGLPPDPVGTARYDFFYGRAAAGAGQSARPYMKTYRLGIQLPTPIHTQANGIVTNLTVTGMPANSFYQVDPANGRIYTTANVENVPLSITYTGVDEATGGPLPPVTLTNVPVTMITERTESPVLIEQAINEGQPFVFPDPLDDTNPANRRPGLIWIFWMSTRAGGPDLYFQTIAPKFTPVPVGRP